jgi:hypothetical protein
MIAHVVLFEPLGDFDDATRDVLVDTIARATREIQGIRRFRVGPRITHGLPGYEKAMTVGYGYAAIIEFDDVDGLAEYLRHPAHAALGQFFTTGVSRALAYDFELVDADEFLRPQPSGSANRLR